MKKLCTLLFLLASGSAYAVSFDCAKAATRQEKAICASPQLGAADDQLAAAYKAALALAPAEMANVVRDDQRAWVRSVALGCPATGKFAVDNLDECLGLVYAARIKQLKSLVQRQGEVTFVWRWILRSAKDQPDPEAPPCLQATIPGSSALTVFWPQASSGAPEWKAWNAALEAALRTFNHGDQPGPAASWDEALGGSLDADSDLTVTLRSVGKQLVTASIEGLGVGHCAASPNNSARQFNWLLAEQRELKASDVFRAGSGWEKLLEANCAKQLTAMLRQQGMAIKDSGLLEQLHDVVVKPTNWQMDAKGLTIVFSDDNISPHAAVPDPVTIPWAALKPALQASFAPPMQ